MLTPDTGTDEDTLDRTQEEPEGTRKVTPPAAKRCLSIDTDVVEDIHGEWDDKKKLMDVIAEKERKVSDNVAWDLPWFICVASSRI